MNTTYTEIEIHIRPATPGTNDYPVDARLDDGTPFSGQFQLNKTALLEIEHKGDNAAYGLELFNALFSGKIGQAYDQVVGRARETTGGRVRVRLWIDREAAELQAIRWERLYHQPTQQEAALTANALTPFSRFLGVSLPAAPAITERPIRILFAIANPTDLPKDLYPVEVEKEIESLHKALGNLKESQTFRVTVMPGHTVLSDELREKLEGDGYQIEEEKTTRDNLLRLLPYYHVLHFVGHGHFTRKTETGPGVAYLYLETDLGSWDRVKDSELVGPLANINPQPQLIFLSACESAKTDASAEHPFVGLAPKLVEAGIPAVVAMQELVEMGQARQLTGDFYRRLHQHGIVDLALNEARNLLWSEKSSDWSIPALFMRLETGQLFDIAGKPDAKTVPFMVQDLPDNYEPRPKLLQQVDELIFDGEKAPQPVTVGLHGFGGYGKTVLAQALCHEVRESFPDGILWVTLGETPGDLTEKVSGLIQGLTREQRSFTSFEVAMDHYKKAIGEQQLLIVVDDVWNEVHLRPFLEGGPNCTRLITTRILTSLPADALLIDVGAMLETEAIGLLTYQLPVADGKQAFEKLADRLGYWPLLLRLANAALREQAKIGLSLPEAATYVDEGLNEEGLIVFDSQNPLERNQAVASTVGVSLKLLEKDDSERFRELAVFPEDVDIPLTAVSTLWGVTGGLSLFRVRQLCTRLNGLSLLQSYDGQRQVIHVHDVLRAYLQSQLDGQAPELHTTLVDAWGDFRFPDRPQTYDKYALRWAAYHLATAAQASTPDQHHLLTRRLVGLVVRPDFASTHIAEVNDLPALQRDLELAVGCAADDEDPEAVALVIAAALALTKFRREQLRPEPLFELARAGELKTARGRVDLFGMDDKWRQVALLSLAWLAAEKDAAGAQELHRLVGSELLDSKRVRTLWARIDADLNKAEMPELEALETTPQEALVQAIVDRLGGAGADMELLARHDMVIDTNAELQAHTGYLAWQDGPKLVSFALAHPEKGRKYLEQYLQAHATYGYAYYRQQSLWVLLDFVLRHPDQAWVREMLAQLAVPALAGSRLDFRAGLPLTIRALQAKLGDDDARADLDTRYDKLMQRAAIMGALPQQHPYAINAGSLMHGDDSEPGDTWGWYKRIMGTLAEALSMLEMVEGDDIKATDLLDAALKFPYGFAGFQAPACLTLAESLAIAKYPDGMIEEAREQAQVAAHNIQDSTFCARLTARVNAMRAWWWPGPDNPFAEPTGFPTTGREERLRKDASGPEFSSLHRVGHVYYGRTGVEESPDGIAGPAMSLPLSDELKWADTLATIAKAYDRPLSEFRRLNNYDDSAILPSGYPVLVPDPGFATYLAARLAADILNEPATSMEEQVRRIERIKTLVPVAAANPTALDTVLSRLLLAASPRIETELLAILAGLMPYSDEEVPEGSGNPSAIRELTFFVP